MENILKLLSLVLYYSIASNLPNYSFPGGKLFNWIRIKCMRGFTIVGTNCRVMRKVYVGNGKDISIGSNCRINENVRLDNVKIGNYVMIARDTVLLGKTHESTDTFVPMEQQGNKTMKQTIIEDDVWLGLRVIVLPGIKIGRGSIIGAGAVVTKSTEEYGIYAGVPAKLIRKREQNG